MVSSHDEKKLANDPMMRLGKTAIDAMKDEARWQIYSSYDVVRKQNRLL